MQLNWNPPRINAKVAHYSWGDSEVNYAPKVHEGEVRRDGTEMPARPWVDAAVQEFDAEQAFQEGYLVARGDISQAFNATAEALSELFQYMIEDERWEWDRPTLRSNGAIVTSPRDIVDTGALKRSQRMEIE